MQQNCGAVFFLGSLLMGKGTCALWCPFLSPMTNAPLSGPAACVPSLGCTSLASTLAPAPAAPNKGGGQHLPFSSPKSPQSGQAQGSSQLHLFSHQYNLPGGNQLRAGSCWCQVKAAEGTLWVCAIRHTLLALGEALNASSQPWQCCGRTALSPSGMLPGILLSCQAAKPPWLMFRSACMGSSTYLGVGENQGFCHPNQCFNRCLYLLDWWCLDLPPPRVPGLPPLTERPFPLFIVLLQSALSSESIL